MPCIQFRCRAWLLMESNLELFFSVLLDLLFLFFSHIILFRFSFRHHFSVFFPASSFTFQFVWFALQFFPSGWRWTPSWRWISQFGCTWTPWTSQFSQFAPPVQSLMCTSVSELKFWLMTCFFAYVCVECGCCWRSWLSILEIHLGVHLPSPAFPLSPPTSPWPLFCFFFSRRVAMDWTWGRLSIYCPPVGITDW